MAITLVTAPENFYPYLDNFIYNNGKGKLCVGNSVVTDYSGSDINANKNWLFPVNFWGWGSDVVRGDKDVVFGKFTGKYRLRSQSTTDTKNLQNLYGGNNDHRMYEVILFNPYINTTDEGSLASYQVEFWDYNNDFSGNITGISNYNSYLKAVEDDSSVIAVVWRDFQGLYFPHTSKEYNDFNLAQTGKRVLDWDVYFKDFNQKFITVFKKIFNISKNIVWRGYDYIPVNYKSIYLWSVEYGLGGPARIYGNSVQNLGVQLDDLSFVETGVCYSKVNAVPTIGVDFKSIRTDQTIVSGQYSINITGLDLNTNYYMVSYATYSNGDVVYSAVQEVHTKTTKVLPSFTFSVAGTITKNSAKIACRVFENDYTVSEAGICYSVNPNPTTSSNKIPLDVLPGGNISITGLTTNTKYYVRQYAIYNGGTVYSALNTNVKLVFIGDHYYSVGTAEGDYPYAMLTDYFTTAGSVVLGKVISSLPTEIQLNQTSVSLVSQITSEGGGAVSESGMWLSTSPNPAITGKKTVFTGSYVTGSFGKQFTMTYTGLIPGTVYYYAPYCKNTAGTYVSNDTTLLFKTYENTAIKIIKSTKLSSTSLSVDYNFTSIGKGVVDAVGLCFKQTGTPTVDDLKTIDGTVLGNYTTIIGLLQNNVSYNIRPYVTKTVNGGSTVTEYGDMITNSMTDVAVVNPNPIVVSIDSDGWKLENRSALISANINSIGTSAITRKGFVLASVDNLLDVTPITGIADPTNENVGEGQFVEEVTLNGNGNELGLMWKYINPAAGKYHFASFAVNGNGTSYGAVKFLTIPSLSDLGLDNPAEVVTSNPITNKTSATLWGVANYNWEAVIEERGFEYWKKSTPGTVNEILIDIESPAFSYNATDLLPNTEYEFKALITESGGSRVYGETVEFTTLETDIPEPTVMLQSALKNDVGFECFVESLQHEELILGKGVVWIRSDDGEFNGIPTINDNRTPVGINGEDLQMNVGVGWYMIAAYIETEHWIRVSLDGLKIVQWTADTPEEDEVGNPSIDITAKFQPPKNPKPYTGQEYYFKTKKYIFNGEGWVKQPTYDVGTNPIPDGDANGGLGGLSVSKSSTVGSKATDVVEYAKRDVLGNLIDETYFTNLNAYWKASINIQPILTVDDLNSTVVSGFYHVILSEDYAPFGATETTGAPVTLIVNEIIDVDMSHQLAIVYNDGNMTMLFRSLSSGVVGDAPDFGWKTVKSTSAIKSLQGVTFELSDQDIVFASGTTTITLPLASDFKNKEYVIKSTNELVGDGTITVNATSPDYIDYGTTLSVPYLDTIRLISDGTQWWKL